MALSLADPHCHTTASDGMVEPAALVAAARAAGLALIALCDHHTMADAAEGRARDRGARAVAAADPPSGASAWPRAVAESEGSTAAAFRTAVRGRRTTPRRGRPPSVPAGLALRQQWSSLVRLPARRLTGRL